jgi:hypothetical protein
MQKRSRWRWSAVVCQGVSDPIPVSLKYNGIKCNVVNARLGAVMLTSQAGNDNCFVLALSIS